MSGHPQDILTTTPGHPQDIYSLDKEGNTLSLAFTSSNEPVKTVNVLPKPELLYATAHNYAQLRNGAGG